MSEETDRERDAEWQSYQERIGNRTAAEEAAIRAAFRAGWDAALRRPLTAADLTRIADGELASERPAP